MSALHRLLKDRTGAAALEFSLVAMPLLILVVGTVELAVGAFIGSTLESAVLDASRYGITGGTKDGVPRAERVRNMVAQKTLGLVDMDRVELETLVYQSFDDIGQPEPFTDSNKDGSYNSGEPYTDVNGNGKWDPDMGAVGLGGPGDIVIYNISYEWGIITPFMHNIVGPFLTQSASIAVRNEPF